VRRRNAVGAAGCREWAAGAGAGGMGGAVDARRFLISN